MRHLIVALLMALIGSTAGSAHGAEPRDPKKAGVIDLEALVIEGKVSKPQVFYVLGRSRIEYESLKLQRTFVGRIIDTAKKNPF